MLDRDSWSGKRVLLLQGPLGPFFGRLANSLQAAGAEVRKINFNGGDWAFFPGGEAYTGTLQDWPGHFQALLTDWKPQAVALFGDRRPIHERIASISKAEGVDCYVFEEGYFRPSFIACELGGVNAQSSIPRDPAFYRALRPEQEIMEVEPPRSAYWYMVLWACVYYFFGALLSPIFRHYQHHRRYSLTECLLWIRGAVRKWWRKWLERDEQQVLTTLWSQRFFLVPLQVHNDAQVTRNSRFGDVTKFISEVVASFALAAPKDTVLVLKHHPMDRAYRNYASLIEHLSWVFDVRGRVKYIHDQHLPSLLEHATGVVVINSTAGLSAIHQGVPTITLGDAFYDFAGMTFQGSLEEFWWQRGRARPDRSLYHAFRRWVIRHTQINDNFYAGPLRGLAVNNERLWRAHEQPSSDLTPVSRRR
ncbi:MAG: capsule biosynthesis protein [Burkholderiales bacterium]